MSQKVCNLYFILEIKTSSKLLRVFSQHYYSEEITRNYRARKIRFLDFSLKTGTL